MVAGHLGGGEREGTEDTLECEMTHSEGERAHQRGDRGGDGEADFEEKGGGGGPVTLGLR